MKTASLLPFLLLLAAGCQNPAPGYVPVPPPPVEKVEPDALTSASRLMPLDVGYRWTYDLRVQTYAPNGKELPEYTDVVEIAITDKRPDGAAVMMVTQNGQTVDRQVWQATDKGLIQLESGLQRAPFQPPQPLFLTPLETGRRFSWRGQSLMSDGLVSRGKADSEVLAPQKVDTAMGSVSAIPIMSHIDFGHGKTEAAAWFKPGVGIVRLRQETFTSKRHDVLTLTLRNTYVPKKS